MCAVCVEFQLGRITKAEAERALNELVFTDPNFKVDHIQEVEEMLDADPSHK